MSDAHVKCIILHPDQLVNQDPKRRPVVGIQERLIGCLHSSDDREEECKEVRGQVGKEESWVDQVQQPGEAEGNHDLAEKDATLWIP